MRTVILTRLLSIQLTLPSSINSPLELNGSTTLSDWHLLPIYLMQYKIYEKNLNCFVQQYLIHLIPYIYIFIWVNDTSLSSFIRSTGPNSFNFLYIYIFIWVKDTSVSFFISIIRIMNIEAVG